MPLMAQDKELYMQLHRALFGIGGNGEAFASQTPLATAGQAWAVLVGVYELMFTPVGSAMAICDESAE